jgi:hypothetical protein
MVNTGSKRLVILPMACCLLNLAAGCGLAEYQAQLARTQKRLQSVDEENELLAGPLEFPERGPEIFFRPPQPVQTKASPKNVPASDGLFHFPAADSKAAMPTVEVIAGALPRSDRFRDEDRVFAYLKNDFLKAHAGGAVWPRDGGQPVKAVYELKSDPRQQVEYRRLNLAADEKPLWPTPNRAVLPHQVVYHYDVYVHPTSTSWVVIILKQLNQEQTTDSWKGQGFDPETLKQIPTADAKKRQEQQRLSLATLRTGPAAEAFLHGRNR